VSEEPPVGRYGRLVVPGGEIPADESGQHVTVWSGHRFFRTPAREDFHDVLASALSGPPDTIVGTGDYWVETYRGEFKGWIISFRDGNRSILAWCPDTADFLDLMTTRVPVWCGLRSRSKG
jgi:hypothetical protein